MPHTLPADATGLPEDFQGILAAMAAEFAVMDALLARADSIVGGRP